MSQAVEMVQEDGLQGGGGGVTVVLTTCVVEYYILTDFSFFLHKVMHTAKCP